MIGEKVNKKFAFLRSSVQIASQPLERYRNSLAIM